MSTVIKIKYSASTVQPADDALQLAEPAYSYMSGGKLFIGADNSGTIVPHVIGGKYFTDMLDHNPGTLTAGSALIVDNNSKLNEFKVDGLHLDGTGIVVTDTNADLELTANGTGQIVLNSALSTSSAIDIGNLKIEANTISAENDNGEIILNPRGNGLVKVTTDQGLLIASGTEGTRPSAATTPSGTIRYNETDNRFEGVVNGNWTGLGGVVDIDQDTYITAEENADEDKLKFYTAGVSRLVIDDQAVAASVHVTAPKVTVDDIILDHDVIEINGSTIQATGTTSAGQIILDPAPAAGSNGGDLVVRGNLQVTGTTTTVNSTVVEIADPIMSIGDDSVIDLENRGIETKYGIDDGNDGVTAQKAFFGWDRSPATDAFTFTKDGFLGDAKFKGLHLSGSITAIDGVAPIAGQLLIGNGTNGDLELATLTAGDSIVVTNSDGGIEIDVEPAQAVATADIHDTGDGVTNYASAAANANARGAATFASEQFDVTGGHVVITVIDGGQF